MKCIVIKVNAPADLAYEVRELEQNGTGFVNKFLQETVGGWFEIVRPQELPAGIVMVVDEEGLLKEK
ncbi:MAG: DUF3846 domain-containing protein, partial [Candidatus Amoebophilus sp.]